MPRPKKTEERIGKRARSNYTRLGGTGGKPITEDTPLTPVEQKFIREYIKIGRGGDALHKADKTLPLDKCSRTAAEILKQPNVQKEVRKIMAEIHDATVADSVEVLKYFTSVMRGEVKDQFGLEAPLSERTKAAQELAKRTVDIENRKAGEPDQTIAIKLDWSR